MAKLEVVSKINPEMQALAANPEERACCLWKWTFSWMNPLLRQSLSKGALESEDLYHIRQTEMTANSLQRMESALEKSRLTPDGPVDVKRALIIMFRRDFIITASVKMVNTVVQVIPFIALRGFLQWRKEEGSKGWGIFWIAVIFLCMVTKAFTENIYFHLATLTSIQVRTALMTVLYTKTLRLSLHARQTFTTGEVVNLLQIWTQRLEEFFAMKLHVLWDGAVQIAAYVGIACWLVGPAAIAGIILMFPLAVAQGKVMKAVGRVRMSAAKMADQRVRMVTEIFSGIRAIKGYCWEKPFSAEVERVRAAEIKNLRRLAVLTGVLRSVMTTSPQIILLCVFVVYAVAFDHAMEPAIVFTTLAVFQNVRMSLMFYPMALAGLVDARQGMARIQTYLNAIEVVPQQGKAVQALTDGSEAGTVGEVRIEGATLSYRKQGQVQSRAGFDPKPKKAAKSSKAKANADTKVLPNEAQSPQPGAEAGAQTGPTGMVDAETGSAGVERVEVLRNMSFDVKAGSLVTVVGPVGSGKSSLVAAVLGELVTLTGSVSSSGRVAYAPQLPWIMNATVRDNILFERPYDKERYEWVLDACCLRADLEQLPSADYTEIGERGITLSGGQKQRVSLARCMYTDADLYVFDDPLSALDAETAAAVFSKCVLSPALRGKTRLLITHALFTLPSSDMVVVLKHDVDGCGVLASVGKPDTMDEAIVRQITEEKSAEKVSETAVVPTATKPTMTSETKAKGNIKSQVYKGYFKAVGSTMLWLSVAATNVGTIVFQNGSVFWLSLWSDGSLDNHGFEDWHYVLGYGALAIVCVLVSFMSAVSVVIVGNRASHRLHTDLFSSVLHAPLAFFDTTPLGRIVNRFSQDVESLDTKLPENLSMLLLCGLNVVGMLVSISVAVPMAAIGVPVLGMVYYHILQQYRVGNREIKRLDSMALSPIFAYFQQTLGGISTIRAYGASPTFILAMMSRIDHHTRAHYCMKCINRWLSVRLELLGSFVLLVTGLMAVYFDGTSAGFAGVAMVYALQCTGTMNWTVRTVGETEAAMNCAERILEYISETPSEGAHHVAGVAPSWPETGAISFENVSVRYRPGLPMVLKSLSVTIESPWRVGVVGRTGSGKSTLLLAVMRLIEPAEGHITISGVKTSDLGLADLRSKIAVVPQDPVLWTGSLHKNLDPFSQCSEAAVWNALEAVGQKAALEQRFPGVKIGDIDVSEYGENFSHGQRQLFCMARAMLKNSKIVLMDEATSALDEETDSLVQHAVRDLFQDATMLIVAHRLRTIASADRILLLDQGTRLEYDTPKALLDNKSSQFSALVDELGAEEKRLVLQRAGVVDLVSDKTLVSV
jgi:ABC-type multidrug transport system fused ATPase/permease subunit